MKRIGIGVCFALVCGSASAQAPDALDAIDQHYETCLTKAAGVTPALNQCSFEAQAAADKVLNRTYGHWVDDLKHPGKDDAAEAADILKRLIASQRAWIGYRDTACSLESTSMLGGTGETTVYGGCLYRMTRQRVLDLKQVQDHR